MRLLFSGGHMEKIFGKDGVMDSEGHVRIMLLIEVTDRCCVQKFVFVYKNAQYCRHIAD